MRDVDLARKEEGGGKGKIENILIESWQRVGLLCLYVYVSLPEMYQGTSLEQPLSPHQGISERHLTNSTNFRTPRMH